jgi:hypothetical protein
MPQRAAGLIPRVFPEKENLMPFVRGYLRVFGRGHPDAGLPEGPPGHVDAGLPEQPVDPGFGGGIAGLPDPDYGLPLPPPGVWPPPNATLPIVPAPPGTPPGAIWPPVGVPPIWTKPGSPGHPSGQPLPPPGETPPERPTPAPTPPRPDQGLPGANGTFWVVAGIPGVGWRYVCVDPSLRPSHELPGGAPPRLDNELPPTAQPRRS